MKTLHLLCAILLLSVVASAQPNYKVKKYSVERGKKEKFYVKQANRLIKKGERDEALLNAATGLMLAVKKKDISNAQEVLRLHFASTLASNLNTIEGLKSQSETFYDDLTVTDRAEILNIYTVMDQYNDILASLTEDKFAGAKKKDPRLELDIKDYSADVAEARKSLDESIQLAADMHYGDGTDMLGSAASKRDFRDAARSFRYAYTYVSGYQDSEAKYEEAKSKGTINVGIAKFTNKSYGCNSNAPSMLSDGITSKMMAANLEFVNIKSPSQLAMDLGGEITDEAVMMSKLVNDGVGESADIDYVIMGAINTCETKRDILDLEKETHKKEVVVREEKYKDSDGKEKTRKIKETVTAVAYYKKKVASAEIESGYTIIDGKTGSVVHNGTGSGTKAWGKKWRTSYYGNKKALPSGETTDEPAYPSYSSLIQTAVEQTYGGVSEKAIAFAKASTESN